MSMGIHETYGYGRAGLGERWMAQQDLREAEKDKEADGTKEAAGGTGTGRAEKAAGAKEAGVTREVSGAQKAKEVKEPDGSAPMPRDEYIDSERSGRVVKGLYQRGTDENGNQKILYNDPKKTEEKCTGDTDRVDREIRALKEEVKQLRQQIAAAGGDEKKVRGLQQKLAQAEGELGRKDNDTYRKQNMDVVNG